MFDVSFIDLAAGLTTLVAIIVGLLAFTFIAIDVVAHRASTRKHIFTALTPVAFLVCFSLLNHLTYTFMDNDTRDISMQLPLKLSFAASILFGVVFYLILRKFPSLLSKKVYFTVLALLPLTRLTITVLQNL